MFSYYPLLLEKSKSIISKIIYPHDISYITFLQLISLNKKFINNNYNNDKIYNYTNKRQDFIMLNKGKLNIELINKNLNQKCNLIIDNNSLKYNNNILSNQPVLFNIHSSIFYNIKALKKSEFLFYSCDYKNNGNDIEFNYYKINNLHQNNLIKHDTKLYPYFNLKDFKNNLIV